MRCIRVIITLVGLFTMVASLSAQIGGGLPAPAPQPASRVAPVNAAAPPGGDSGAIFNMAPLLTRFEFWLTLLIVIFGVAVILLQFLLLKKHRTTSDDILKVFGVTLIVVGSLVLITAGFSDKQIAPAMGLFGTISGYLLGRASAKAPNKIEPTEGDSQ